MGTSTTMTKCAVLKTRCSRWPARAAVPTCAGRRAALLPPALPSQVYLRRSANSLGQFEYVWFGAEMEPLRAQWSENEVWTLSVVVTSTDKEDRIFGFPGGGGFLQLSVPAGASNQLIT